MKKRIIFFAILTVFTGSLLLQNCTKDESKPPKEWQAAVPTTPVPGEEQVIAYTGANQTVALSWAGAGTNPVKWDVYFGNTEHPPKVASGVATNSYTAKTPTGGTYYWQVYTIDANNVETESPLWQFQVNSSPNAVTLTAPANNATAVSKTVSLTWTATDPENDHLTYDLYLGTATNPGLLKTDIADPTYAPTLAYNTTYYWKVVAKDPYGGSKASSEFKFTTDIFRPDFSVFNGLATEVVPSISGSTKTFTTYVTCNTTTKQITLFLPVADAMVYAGWGTVYSGTHPIVISYNSDTFAVTSADQLWCDSFIDPTEMGPMSLKVASGTIDATAKKITIKWTLSGNAYWGAPYTLPSNSTYTMK